MPTAWFRLDDHYYEVGEAGDVTWYHDAGRSTRPYRVIGASRGCSQGTPVGRRYTGAELLAGNLPAGVRLLLCNDETTWLMHSAAERVERPAWAVPEYP